MFPIFFLSLSLSLSLFPYSLSLPPHTSFPPTLKSFFLKKHAPEQALKKKNKNHIWIQHKTRYLLYEPSVKLPDIMHVKPTYLLPHYSVKKLFSDFIYLSSSCHAPERNLNVSSDKHTSTDCRVVIGIPGKQQKYCIYSVSQIMDLSQTGHSFLLFWLSGYLSILNKK